MQTIRLFNSAQEARDYRQSAGTGGWIFEPENGDQSILFPPEVCPSEIFRHKLTRGMSGRLIGCQ